MDRRSLLALAGYSGFLLATSARRAGALAHAARFEAYPFALGVASGDPRPDSVVLWTRLAPEPQASDGHGGMPPDQPVAVEWEVATDDTFSQVVQQGTATATGALAHSVHVEIDGLSPATDYFYRFRAGPEISPVGRTRTTPPPGTHPAEIKLAFASCQQWAWEPDPYAAYQDMATRNLDLVVHVGDYVYEFISWPDPPTLEGYRARWGGFKENPHLQAVHATVPFAILYDDHEVEDNWAGADQDPSLLTRRAYAFRTLYENLPLRTSQIPSGPTMQLYRSLDIGDLVRLHMLDTRQYRDVQARGWLYAPEHPDVHHPDRQMLGSAQELFLAGSLNNSTARWNALTQQVIMGRFDANTGPEVAVNHDAWDGYVPARQRILDFVHATQVQNPIVISGDWHSGWVNDLLLDFADPDSTVVATEFVTTSISTHCGWAGQVEAALPTNPHVKYFNGSQHGYLECTVTPEAWRSDFRVVADKYDINQGAWTDASWTVLHEAAGAVKT